MEEKKENNLFGNLARLFGYTGDFPDKNLRRYKYCHSVRADLLISNIESFLAFFC